MLLPLGPAVGCTRRWDRAGRGRDHTAEIGARGRMAWQKANGYGRRALVETAISRLKRRGGDRLTARTFGAQCQPLAANPCRSRKDFTAS
jgi:hypothetical protein